MRTDNYYDILGIGRDADDEAVKQAFRDLAKSCHPDRNPGNVDAEHQFKRINTAYEALKDSARRSAYNEWLLFAETRERSGFKQWARLFILIFVLVFGPLVLYLSIMKAPRDSGAATQPVAGSAQATRTPTPTPTPQQQPAKERPAQAVQHPVQPHVAKAVTAPGLAGDTRTDAPMRIDMPAVRKESTTTIIAPTPTATSDIEPATTETLPAPSGGSSLVAKSTPAPAREDKFVREERRAALEQPAADGHAASWATVSPSEVDEPTGSATTQYEQSRVLPPKTPEPSPAASGESLFVDCEHCPSMERRDGAAISRAEITVGEWNACVAEGACQRYGTPFAGDGRRPMRDITLRDAGMYSDWLSRKTGQPYRVAPETNPDAGAAPARNPNCSSEAGWEWLDDNPGCGRRTSGGHAPEFLRSFRVMRPVRSAQD